LSGEIKAVTLDIQRLSTEDGPGLRTTVFFKGCNLACAWCHNPESIALKKQVQWLETRCIGCRLCLAVCGREALSMDENGIRRDREKCLLCAACAEACPARAQEIKGTEWELAALVREVLKDRAYFGSEGGVTVSGGEALLQIAFVEKFLAALKKQGVHTAVDTAGLLPRSVLERVLPWTDLILLDLKLMDAVAHKKFTGADNGLILRNAEFLAARRREGGPELWIRTPMIPGATDTAANVAAIGRFIGEKLQNAPARWELCAFNNLCADKYRRLDMDWQYAGVPPLREAEMEALYSVARQSGARPDMVRRSGATRTED
jgi:pyruvate formate lyase activating enzyme